jgi:hypothetical protein
LLARGEHLLDTARRIALPFGLDFTIEDIEATWESLRTTFLCVHGPHNQPEVHERLARFLNEPQSPH